ncbi:MAG: 50S ribosomal protein L23 [Candidatus Kapaibacteriota bacterium]
MIELIKKPIITEKAMKLGEQRQYVFEVDIEANKIQIKQAVEKMFDVKVESVRTVRLKGKLKRRFTRRGFHYGKTPQRKKAYVTLKEGYSIELVSGAET